ncbi:MAG: transposase, partial [Ruthenibacterium sp.]
IAELKGCSRQNIIKQIRRGSLPHQERRNENNRPQFLVPLDALDACLQERYYRQKSGAVLQNAAVPKKPTATKPVDAYSADERAEIDCWLKIIERWQNYRNKPDAKNKAEVDRMFIALVQLERTDLNISIDILYRKWAAAREENYDGLLDKRGKWKKGQSGTPPDVFKIFETYYLDESQHPVERCIEYTRLYLQKYNPELVAKMPSYSTFFRRAKSIPYAVLMLGRFGEKAYYDLCSPYVRREYENIASNEWWIADTHTFDILSRGENGKTHRIYINAYLDARSGIFTGWYVTENPSSDASLYALRRGITAYGIPNNIYVDNGREYLTTDIGGRGHRAKKVLADGSKPFEPPGVYKRLGITMTNAIVRNARAKIIERRFRDVKDHISRLFMTYTGGTVVEKPDRLKHILKADETALKEALKHHTVIECSKVVRDDELIKIVDTLISGYMNYQAYNGSVSEDIGKRRIDVFNEYLTQQRVAAPEELSLMLMRTGKPQQVERAGVFVKIAGKKIYFNSNDLLALMKEKVYVRYDPDHLGNARVYDMQDRFLLEVPLDNTLRLPYGADKQKISDAMSVIRKARKVHKDALDARKLLLADEDSALSLVMHYAQKNLDEALPASTPPAIELVRAQEEPLLKACNDIGSIDISRMAKNAAMRHKNKEDSQ